MYLHISVYRLYMRVYILHIHYLYNCIIHIKMSQGKFISIPVLIIPCIVSIFLRDRTTAVSLHNKALTTLYDTYVQERQKLTHAAIASFEANCKSSHFSPLHYLFSPEKHYWFYLDVAVRHTMENPALPGAVTINEIPKPNSDNRQKS